MIHFRAQIVSQSIWVQWTKQAKKTKTNLLRTRKYLKINTELKQYSWRNKQLLSNPVVKLLQQTTLKKIISKFQFLADFGLILLLLIFNLSTVRTLLESGGWGVWKPQWLVPSWHDRNIAKHYTSFKGTVFLVQGWSPTSIWNSETETEEKNHTGITRRGKGKQKKIVKHHYCNC